MTKDKIYNPPQEIIDKANISEADFEKLYKMSIDDPENFWSSQAEEYLDWNTKWTQVKVKCDGKSMVPIKRKNQTKR